MERKPYYLGGEVAKAVGWGSGVALGQRQGEGVVEGVTICSSTIFFRELKSITMPEPAPSDGSSVPSMVTCSL